MFFCLISLHYVNGINKVMMTIKWWWKIFDNHVMDFFTNNFRLAKIYSHFTWEKELTTYLNFHAAASLLLVCVSWTIIMVSHETASSSAECSRDKPPFSFVRGQDSTMWDIVWISPEGHRSVSVSRHFLLQAPQSPYSVRKRFSRDHCCRGRSKRSCRIVGSHTRWEFTTWADFQLCLHRLLMSTGCKSSHNGFLDVSRS